MIVNSDDLPRRLTGQLDPIYVISGDDPLLVSEATDAVRARAYEEGFSGRQLHTVERGFDWASAAASGQNMSLFDDKEITEIRIPTGKPGRAGSAALVDIAKNLYDDDCLIVVVPKLDASAKKSAWIKALTTKGTLVQIWPVSPQQLPQWIARRLKTMGLNASRDALLMLADRSQGNLLAAQQEIFKLSLQVTGENISAEDVATAVADSARFDVFQLVDAALVGDAKRSLRILNGLHAEGVEPTLVLWALSREIRTLCTICHAIESGTRLETALGSARVWSTRKALVSRAAQRMRSSSRVVELLQLAAKTDEAIKGMGPGEPWSGLRSLVVGLSLDGAILAVA